MYPSEALQQEFRPRIRQRGGYYLHGAVEILSGGPDEVTAIVNGTRPYEVLILKRREGPHVAFDMACSCPYVADRGEPCKHLWATLWTAERRGFLGGRHTLTGSQGTAYLSAVGPIDPDLDWDPDEDAARPGSQRVPGLTRGRAAARFLDSLQQTLDQRDATTPEPFRYANGELRYTIDVAGSGTGETTQVNVMYVRRKKNGELSVPKQARISAGDIGRAPAPHRRFLAHLAGSAYYDQYYWTPVAERPASYLLSPALAIDLLPQLAEAGLLWLRRTSGAPDRCLTWDADSTWTFHAVVEARPEGYTLSGELRATSGTRADVTDVDLVIDAGLIVLRATIARLEPTPSLALFRHLQASGSIAIPAENAATLAQVLSRLGVPAGEIPPPLQVPAVRVAPRPQLSILPDREPYGARLYARLSFDYDGTVLARSGGETTTFDAVTQRVIHRDRDAEHAAAARLASLGVRVGWHRAEQGFELAAPSLPAVVRTLVVEGWHVDASGARYRASTAMRLNVSSGIDWFDLTGTIEFGDAAASLPSVLAALRSGGPSVRLDDGTLGLLPEDWLRKYAPLASAGEPDGERIRFHRPQAALLDALLADREAEAAIEVDRAFERVREELTTFSSIAPIDPPRSFQGSLRPYQRDGLGWFAFLRRFGFGGCLADDMGLGKTVMVLAMLDARRLERRADEPGLPSLIVVPRSLIGNWLSEAATFTPALRLVDQSHAARAWNDETIGEADGILVTYGTLRRDISLLHGRRFDYVILDEAQAIKNARTAAATAARLLLANHRLALSGTPIENHLGELWSLFEFLNPGVLGRSSAFQRATTAPPGGPADDHLPLLTRALRPFILRRTKQQVARDLPPRTEQTIVCELSAKERALYDGLRREYRERVLARVERVGLARSSLHVLEALLRLRQAACHPTLVDRSAKRGTSAKFDVLLPRLREVLDEGHKAIVFSQFTTLLGLLRERLDADAIPYEYLDGRTKNRSARVERFQTDPSIGLFLISLKAGGVGLNLTAAEYVFLLDPWWNPAVEAQAIDRTHRIGQTREVFAYRLIAKDTVEEKVLALQQSKKALADAVLSADAVGLRHLQREDVEMLLS